MSYVRRIIDRDLDEIMPHLAAISIEGPKGVGKTMTAAQRARSIYAMDDPASAQLIAASPELLRSAPKPVLIDEWQRMPMVWDMVRRLVDDDSSGGQILLTGSATPTGAAMHSGAGRIVSLRMRPMSLFERQLAPSTVSLQALLDGKPEIGGHTSVSLRDYVAEITASGFPDIRHLPSRPRRAQLDGYITRVIEREFAELGISVRRPQTLRSWLAAYAAATASTASYAAILDAATPGLPNKPARTTVTTYRDVLQQLWLLDPLDAWLPSRNEFVRLGSTPKHYLADPALTARLLGLDEDRLIMGADHSMLGPQDGTALGRLFESLLALSLKVYAQSAEAEISHFRSRDGKREIDFIIHRGDGATVAFEAKMSRTITSSDVKHLLWLKAQLGNDLRDMAVIYSGESAYRRSDGVAVIPAALLGP